MHFRLLIWLGLGIFVSSLHAARPNILIIFTDDQGFHDVSYYNKKDIKTPAIDALAAAGMRFDNFYANCPVCSPSRAALLTGRQQDLVGVQGVIRDLELNTWGYWDPQSTSIATVLRRNGYQTAIVGKWHLGLESPNLPNDRGFAFFKGFIGDMMDDYYDHRRHGHNFMRLNYQEIDPEGHATDLFTQWAIDYIGDAAGGEEPFFLYLAYNAPHSPIQPPKDWLETVMKREPGISEKRAKFVALTEHMDFGIGKVIQSLKDNGIYEDTLIFFTSDNGGSLHFGSDNGPLRDQKGSVYEGGLRVPAAVVWNGQIRAGSNTSHTAMTMDIFPTILDICGINWNGPVDGVSFAPVLRGESVDVTERAMIFSRREGGLAYNGKTIEAVRIGDFKLLQNSPFETLEMYNIAKDPYEKNNLLAGKQSNEFGKVPHFNELRARLSLHYQERGRIPWQPPSR
ncbi:MAG: sulfatase-like hydrolase/transferase [Verrucomicrobiae bacterium]|nr:sulfatase-like hydrolase/transferase [Verrucomicrobiae bacterium]